MQSFHNRYNIEHYAVYLKVVCLLPIHFNRKIIIKRKEKLPDMQRNRKSIPHDQRKRSVNRNIPGMTEIMELTNTLNNYYKYIVEYKGNRVSGFILLPGLHLHTIKEVLEQEAVYKNKNLNNYKHR